VILDIWEQGSGLHPIERALLVLSGACPEHTFEELSEMSLGSRDALLLKMRRQNFGDRLDAYTECPECHEQLEFTMSCGEFLGDAAAPDTTTKTVSIEGIHYNLRCPNSYDAAIAADCRSVEAAKRTLLSRCTSTFDGASLDIEALPESVQAGIAAELAEIDTRVEMLMDLACPSCGHKWQSVFDVLPFIWTEIRARARRLLQEVDALARAYGWSETDILGMSDARRALYIQMAVS
jgi:hypothetical protein